MGKAITYQFKDNKEQIVDDKRPLAAVAIAGNTEQYGADRPKHEHESDAPGNVRLGLAKLLGKVGNGQGDGEEVERIPGLKEKGRVSDSQLATCLPHPTASRARPGEKDAYPSEKGNCEKRPLLGREHAKKLPRIGDRVHGRSQGREARGEVLACAHAFVGRGSGAGARSRLVFVAHDDDGKGAAGTRCL